MNSLLPECLRVIDSHTGGEPTRVLLNSYPELETGSMAERRVLFEKSFDELRSALVLEPRGSDVLVGALLCAPERPDSDFGVIFFNNVGTLGSCGHGTIGVVATLQYLGRIHHGRVRLDTPVGLVDAQLDDNNLVSVRNVSSYRYKKDVPVTVPGVGEIRGDIAWGGNWFFLVSNHGEDISLRNAERLTELAWRIRQALQSQGISGQYGAVIDHVELFGPPKNQENHSRNFVLCPGRAYDRSPCGTGTSAKLACLHADGKLKAGEVWRQESVVGSVFEGWVEPTAEGVQPTIRGSAYITADTMLRFQANDPFRTGLRP